jgi:hypothetical protein
MELFSEKVGCEVPISMSLNRSSMRHPIERDRSIVLWGKEATFVPNMKMNQLAWLHRLPWRKFDRSGVFPLPPERKPYGRILGGTAGSCSSNTLNSMLWGLPELDVLLCVSNYEVLG